MMKYIIKKTKFEEPNSSSDDGYRKKVSMEKTSVEIGSGDGLVEKRNGNNDIMEKMCVDIGRGDKLCKKVSFEEALSSLSGEERTNELVEKTSLEFGSGDDMVEKRDRNNDLMEKMSGDIVTSDVFCKKVLSLSGEKRKNEPVEEMSVVFRSSDGFCKKVPLEKISSLSGVKRSNNLMEKTSGDFGCGDRLCEKVSENNKYMEKISVGFRSRNVFSEKVAVGNQSPALSADERNNESLEKRSADFGTWNVLSEKVSLEKPQSPLNNENRMGKMIADLASNNRFCKRVSGYNESTEKINVELGIRRVLCEKITLGNQPFPLSGKICEKRNESKKKFSVDFGVGNVLSEKVALEKQQSPLSGKTCEKRNDESMEKQIVVYGSGNELVEIQSSSPLSDEACEKRSDVSTEKQIVVFGSSNELVEIQSLSPLSDETCEKRNELTEKTSLDFDFSKLPSDPGLRPSIMDYDLNIRERIRRYYALNGPCQPRRHEFKRTERFGKSRRFVATWFDEFKWLEYSVTKESAFCLYCYLFKSECGKLGGGGEKFVTEGFTDWKSKEKFRIHEGGPNSSHSKAYNKFRNLLKQEQHVETSFVKMTKEVKLDYRMPAGAIHPAVMPVSYLLGTWKGKGEGGFPTIASFNYGEELNFTLSGSKPVIAYSQKTWKLESGEPMHSESGYWRFKPDGTIEVVIAQSTGLLELQKGTYEANGKVLKLQSELVGNASKVKEITRVFKLVDDELIYEVEMATKSMGLQPHLKASFKKV